MVMEGKDLKLDFNSIYIVQNARVSGLVEMRQTEAGTPYGLKLTFDNGAEIQCMYEDGHVPISVDNASAPDSRA